MSQILLHLSVAVRLLAFGWSVALVVRFRDRRLILLSAVLALMATRQALTDVLSLAGRASEAAVIAELPGLLVSIGMLLVVILIGRMIADYREAIRTASASAAALRENEARLQFVVDQAPVVLWALDQDGVFTLSEGRSLDVLGLEAGQVVGRSVFDVYEGHDEILDDARRALAGHHIRSVVQVGGTVFESRQRPITDASGVVRGVIGVATDVTARERAMRQLETSHRAVSEAYDHTLEGWVRALDLRDRETEGHTQRVTELTVELARSLGVPADEIEHIRRGALLHDIGKIGIPDSVLNKQGPPDDAEWELMRKHPVWAREMIAAVPFLEPALDIPYCHHERWDGTGYPQGLTGRSIPLAARAFAVVDVWDALLSERPYSPPWTEVEALAHLRAEAGGQFDPEVVTGFLGLLQERTREA
jgi:PAS domain S-box-containing protein/putative nucleotidyltransferase with HDIG domain